LDKKLFEKLFEGYFLIKENISNNHGLIWKKSKRKATIKIYVLYFSMITGTKIEKNKKEKKIFDTTKI
jgi:hypothetical protein